MARKKISKQAKWRLTTYGVLSLFLICYFLYVAIASTYSFIALRNEERELQKELARLSEEQEQLEREIVRLNDPQYLLNFARKNYQYSKEGELIIQLYEREEVEEEFSPSYDYNLWWYAGSGTILLIAGFIFFKKK